MQMAERLNGIELNKDYLDNLKENRKKFLKMFTTPTVELCKFCLIKIKVRKFPV